MQFIAIQYQKLSYSFSFHLSTITLGSIMLQIDVNVYRKSHFIGGAHAEEFSFMQRETIVA
jgi:hypothetical protein